jgi:hypothetical protein
MLRPRPPPSLRKPLLEGGEEDKTDLAYRDHFLQHLCLLNLQMLQGFVKIHNDIKDKNRGLRVRPGVVLWAGSILRYTGEDVICRKAEHADRQEEQQFKAADGKRSFELFNTETLRDRGPGWSHLIEANGAEDTKDWPGLINEPSEGQDANLLEMQIDSCMYFIVIRDLHEGEELLVHYGPDYPRTWTPGNRAEPLDELLKRAVLRKVRGL